MYVGSGMALRVGEVRCMQFGESQEESRARARARARFCGLCWPSLSTDRALWEVKVTCNGVGTNPIRYGKDVLVQHGPTNM